MKSAFFRDGRQNPISSFTKSVLCLSAFLGMFGVNKITAAQDKESKNSDVGAALDSIFDVRRAPKAKSMGLLRRSFLDVVEPKQSLQIAFVVDTTESMESQIAAIRYRLPNMVADLGRLVDGNIESTAVTIADIGNGGVPIQILSPTFLNSQLFSEAISKLKVSDGRPYFLEPVDLGIHTALQQLPWSDKDNVQKWIFFFGRCASL